MRSPAAEEDPPVSWLTVTNAYEQGIRGIKGVEY
jgi:hypothetical protein